MKNASESASKVPRRIITIPVTVRDAAECATPAEQFIAERQTGQIIAALLKAAPQPGKKSPTGAASDSEDR